MWWEEGWWLWAWAMLRPSGALPSSAGPAEETCLCLAAMLLSTLCQALTCPCLAPVGTDLSGSPIPHVI